MAKLAVSKGLRPHLLVHPNCLEDFKNVPTSDPNCVVIGDASDEFSYKAMNEVGPPDQDGPVFTFDPD